MFSQTIELEDLITDLDDKINLALTRSNKIITRKKIIINMLGKISNHPVTDILITIHHPKAVNFRTQLKSCL